MDAFMAVSLDFWSERGLPIIREKWQSMVVATYESVGSVVLDTQPTRDMENSSARKAEKRKGLACKKLLSVCS